MDPKYIIGVFEGDKESFLIPSICASYLYVIGIYDFLVAAIITITSVILYREMTILKRKEEEGAPLVTETGSEISKEEWENMDDKEALEEIGMLRTIWPVVRWASLFYLNFLLTLYVLWGYITVRNAELVQDDIIFHILFFIIGAQSALYIWSAIRSPLASRIFGRIF
jgi:hypothetical protein